MTSPGRNVAVDHVNRLMEAVRIGGGFEMEKFLRVASDIGGYTPETDPFYKPDDLPGASDDIERFEGGSLWLGLKEPEAEVLFDLGRPLYTPSGITREHLLAVLEAICDGKPVDIRVSGSRTIRSGTGKTHHVDRATGCKRLGVNTGNRITRN